MAVPKSDRPASSPAIASVLINRTRSRGDAFLLFSPHPPTHIHTSLPSHRIHIFSDKMDQVSALSVEHSRGRLKRRGIWLTLCLSQRTIRDGNRSTTSSALRTESAHRSTTWPAVAPRLRRRRVSVLLRHWRCCNERRVPTSGNAGADDFRTGDPPHITLHAILKRLPRQGTWSSSQGSAAYPRWQPPWTSDLTHTPSSHLMYTRTGHRHFPGEGPQGGSPGQRGPYSSPGAALRALSQ